MCQNGVQIDLPNTVISCKWIQKDLESPGKEIVLLEEAIIYSIRFSIFEFPFDILSIGMSMMCVMGFELLERLKSDHITKICT